MLGNSPSTNGYQPARPIGSPRGVLVGLYRLEQSFDCLAGGFGDGLGHWWAGPPVADRGPFVAPGVGDERGTHRLPRYVNRDQVIRVAAADEYRDGDEIPPVGLHGLRRGFPRLAIAEESDQPASTCGGAVYLIRHSDVLAGCVVRLGQTRDSGSLGSQFGSEHRTRRRRGIRIARRCHVVANSDVVKSAGTAKIQPAIQRAVKADGSQVTAENWQAVADRTVSAPGPTARLVQFLPISHIMSSKVLHIALVPTGFNSIAPCPDLTDSAPFQRPPVPKGQHLGSDFEISVVVQQCHIMGVGKGGDQ